MADLIFQSWRRSSAMKGAENDGARLKGKLPLTLDDIADDRDPADVSVEVLFRGPGDVAALKSSAIRHVAPRAATSDAETTKFVHIDFFETDLPWRYSPVMPAPATPARLAPWIVLLVGRPNELDVQGGIVRPSAAVLAAHDLAQSFCWAHVQNDSGVMISRLLSPCMLSPLSAYVAVVVPAFDDTGGPSWTGSTLNRDFLPAFYSWRFQTGEQGDFETLAGALKVRKTQSLGLATIRYRRPVADVDVTLLTGGAMISLQSQPDQSTAIVTARHDLDLINDTLADSPPDAPTSREIMQLPRYGELWLDDTEATAWSKSMNDDPRHRGVAGIGLNMAIRAQEKLMTAAVEQAGALQDVAQRVAHLALGLDMAGRLWHRRLPEGPEDQLNILGPAMGRMTTDSGGSVLDAVTSDTSLLDRSLFSSAAMRLLRDGTARARHMKAGRIDRAAVMTDANTPPPSQPHIPDGLPHIDRITKDLGLEPIGHFLPGPDFKGDIEGLLNKFSGQPADANIIAEFIKLAGEMLGLNCLDASGPYFFSLRPPPRFLEREMLIAALNTCRAQRAKPKGSPVKDISALLPPPKTPDRRRPVKLKELVSIVAGAIDPTAQRPPAWTRVAGAIGGLDLKSLAPPEAPIGLDFPTWSLLKKNEPEWLMPGVGSLQNDSIVALKTNPTFIDAFMVGINTQFLAEMRWRNLPAPRVSTPLRMFWGYVDFSTGKREADIQPIGDWPSRKLELPDTDDIGALAHQAFKPGDTTGKEDLVIAFRSALFRRYPSTLVYLVRPPSGVVEGDALDVWLKATPNFAESSANRDNRHYFGPIFQGELQPDVVFFAFDVKPDDLDLYWLVLDEPPAELRFQNKHGSISTSSAELAKKAIDRPTRVAISGKALEAMAVTP